MRTREGRRAAVWASRLALVAVTLLVGCARCGEEPLALLESVRGEVWRDRAEEPGRWKRAEVEERFGLGDGLKTGTASEAVLALRGGGRLRVDPSTIVRFRASPPDRAGGAGPTLAVESGEVELLAGSGARRFWTELGLARIEAGGRLRLGSEGGRRTLRLELGRATLERSGEPVRTLLPGEGVSLEIGRAELEPLALVPPADGGGGEPAGARGADAGAMLDAAVDAEAPRTGGRLRVLRGMAKVWEPDQQLPRVVRRRDGERSLPFGARIALRGRAVLTREHGELSLLGGASVRHDEEVDELLAGAARLRGGASEGALRLAVPGGFVEARGDAFVRRRRGGLEVRAESGAVLLRGRGGVVRLSPGERARLRDDGRVELPERAVDRFHLVVPAGERFTVRAARLPVAVGFRFGTRCEGVGTVELLRGSRVVARARGEGVAGLRLGRGGYRYRVQCQEGRKVAEGRARVVRDSGRTPLPRTPPSTLVDADGRRYLVLYQNLLPEIVVRWRDAPEAEHYVLRVRSGTKERSFPGTSPRRTLRSGTLPEGGHELWFEAAGRSSPRTRLRIAFDNAATVASLRAPDDGSFAPGETVRVRGVALRGWRVSVGGEELPLDEQARFDAEVPVSSDRLGLAIRMAHPSRGVQYYVRRARTR